MVRAVFFDCEGTLLIDGKVRGEAPEAIRDLKAAGYLVRILTNATARSRQTLCADLSDIGLPVNADEIYTPIEAAYSFLAQQRRRRVFPVIAHGVQATLQEFLSISLPCDWVLVGDMATEISNVVLNRALQELLGGAKLLSLSPNAHCKDGDGVRLDCGAYVSALEYASGQSAILLGKPSALFFAPILRDLRLQPSQAVMVGDSIGTDMVGARRAGIRAILARTGGHAAAEAEFQEVVDLREVQNLVDRIEVE
jgi:HAD superfamily hydrolase (TIGR01458 family)